MLYRKLGSTGPEVSVIGFGASALGNVFGNVLDSEANEAVAAAIDAGVNLFDVSPYYGLTLAEQRLGDALQGKRSNVLLGAKCGRYGAEDFDFSARAITESVEQSLRRLRTDYVDLLQAHDIEFGDIGQIVHETVPAMRKLRDAGKVRLIGITGYWPNLLARVAQQTGVDCVLNYCHANLFGDRMQQQLVPAAQQMGFGLLNASPLHMGLLGNRPIPAWHPAPQQVRDAATQIRKLCAEAGIDPAMLALRVCLDMPGIASTFVGISNRAELQTALQALQWSAPESLLAAVRRVVEPVFNTVWPSGLPQNSDIVLNAEAVA